MNHRKMFEKLIQDENIEGNLLINDDLIDVSDDSTAIYFKVGENKKGSVGGHLLFQFDKKGRMINIQVATGKKGKKLTVANSGEFIKFY